MTESKIRMSISQKLETSYKTAPYQWDYLDSNNQRN